jgi:hypothetical protein
MNLCLMAMNRTFHYKVKEHNDIGYNFTLLSFTRVEGIESDKYANLLTVDMIYSCNLQL